MLLVLWGRADYWTQITIFVLAYLLVFTDNKRWATKNWKGLGRGLCAAVLNTPWNRSCRRKTANFSLSEKNNFEKQKKSCNKKRATKNWKGLGRGLCAAVLNTPWKRSCCHGTANFSLSPAMKSNRSNNTCFESVSADSNDIIILISVFFDY